MSDDNVNRVSHDYDVIIVGGGLAGSSLAAALADSELSVAMIDQSVPSTTFAQRVGGADGYDPRVSALTARSQAFLTRLGVWQDIVDAGVAQYRYMKIWDGSGTAELALSAMEANCDFLGHIVENSITVSALMKRITEARNIDIVAPATVATLDPIANVDGENNEACWQLTLADGRLLKAALIVAADGALSPLRQQAKLETREWDYHHCGLVCTVQTQYSHQATAWQRFTDDGVLAFLPLVSDDAEHYCSIVWSVPPERAEALLALSDAEFKEQLARQFEERLGKIIAVSRRFSFPLRQRHAKQYYRPGLVLVADAAHTIHPLAGQGINLGLKDTEVLAEELLRARRRGIGLGCTGTLARYQRRRMADNLRMMSLMEALKQLFGHQSLPIRWLRNTGMRWLSHIAPLKKQLIKQATEG